MNKQEIKFVFFGSDLLSITVLEKLKKLGIIPKLIVTTQDKPKGRGLSLTPSQAKLWAKENSVDCIDPKDLKNVPERLLVEPYDFFLVASYGLLIPQKILDIPKYGTLNVHPSLLPKYRGPTPTQSAILNGDKKAGVTIILLDEKMDHGPIVKQEEFDIGENDSFTFLLIKAGWLGGEMIHQIFLNPDKFISNAQKQNDNLATYTKMIKKEDGLVDIKNDTETYRKFLAFSEWPGIFFFLNKEDKQIRIKVTKAKLVNEKFIIEKVIPEGKKEIEWETFCKNLNIQPFS